MSTIEGRHEGVSESEVHNSISGMPYPASCEVIIEYARNAGADGGVIDLLKKLPDLEYQNEPQVLSTLQEYMNT